jgi:hypothetical protein
MIGKADGRNSNAASAEPVEGPSLRRNGALVLVLFLLTSAVGGSLALEGSYLLVTLLSHIGLGLVTLGVAGYSARVVGPAYEPLPRASAGIAAFAALVATIAGTAYFLGGQSNAALYAMEGFAGVGILAALLMIFLGGPSEKRTSPSPNLEGRTGA